MFPSGVEKHKKAARGSDLNWIKFRGAGAKILLPSQAIKFLPIVGTQFSILSDWYMSGLPWVTDWMYMCINRLHINLYKIMWLANHFPRLKIRLHVSTKRKASWNSFSNIFHKSIIDILTSQLKLLINIRGTKISRNSKQKYCQIQMISMKFLFPIWQLVKPANGPFNRIPNNSHQSMNTTSHIERLKKVTDSDSRLSGPRLNIRKDVFS